MVKRRTRIVPQQRKVLRADFAVEEERYQAWIAFVFDRPSTSNGWYFDMDPWPPEFRSGPVETVGLIGKTAARSGIDLRGFNNTQVYHGLNYIFNGACSDLANSFASDEAPVELKVAALRAMKHLYKDCFKARCGPFLGHLSEGSENRLNMFVYMLWDTTPIHYVNRNVGPVNNAIMDVLEFALGLHNDACIESALHGLGQAHLFVSVLSRANHRPLP